jgi:hypothetical protein
MAAVITRILLRYGAGVLVARGLLGADDASAFSSDPDIQMAIEVGVGAGLSAVSEGWYWLAHKFGWAK